MFKLEDINRWFMIYAKAFIDSDINTIVNMYRFPYEIIHGGQSAIFDVKNDLYHNIEQLCKIYQDLRLSNAT